jgi:hypothetical protein
MLSRNVAFVFAGIDALTAVLVGFGVFVALPSRYWPIDLPAVLLVLGQLAAAVALFAQVPWARRVAAGVSLATLVLGLALVSALALTASWLSGVYGPVGRGGGIILTLVAILALPYLVALPAVQLFWMRPRDSAAP